VGSVSSGERGTLTTEVCCVSASGNYVPSMLIFKRAYITKELFLVCMTHFINSVKPSRENNVLPLLDGHSTHTKNLQALKMAREHGVILLSLPGHTMHRLQPLDVSFFQAPYFLLHRRNEGMVTC
jgi:hypothetical protein